ncbi:MAG: UbiX family flavin prenyltransferase [Firmicutes bacterium]|jgi:4-hydroxy-3-polyprenylbenzoate decarboxylase|nr:UbiX family flavin prenyltransferase [Bacillota bacterium]MDH7495222.1 UbiX family flavin prenyltransferase [Bacillota bacterium]
MRLVVGITGATGAIYGIRVLEALKAGGIESHLVISPWGEKTIEVETSYSVATVKALASHCHDPSALDAPISSGSYLTAGMIIAPCSMKTLAAIANGYSENLLERAADVTIKESRPLVLVVRETPLSAIHLENMLKLARLGVTIMPPVPAFYCRPRSIDDVVNHLVGKILDRFGLSHDLFPRWGSCEHERRE